MRQLPMLALLLNLFATLRSALRTRAELALENLALRQQLAALHRSTLGTSTRNGAKAILGNAALNRWNPLVFLDWLDASDRVHRD